MSYLLDTNVLMHLANETEGASHIRRHYLKALSKGETIAMSTLTAYELEFKILTGPGKVKKANIEALQASAAAVPARPFTRKAADAAAAIGAELQKRGVRIGPLDTLIAGHAVALGYTLVTNNGKEFIRVAGLKVVDWTRR